MVDKLKNDPGKVLFTDVYGPQVPRKHWNERGTFTKQGVYCMMPDGTYLSARFAGTRADDIRSMLMEATETWRKLVKERGLNPQPVPATKAFSDWLQEESETGLHLELCYRDLPRENMKDDRGREVGKSWNRSWLKLSKAEAEELVPSGNEWEVVNEKLTKRIAREALKDIVYGQSPMWNNDAVKVAELKMRKLTNEGGRMVIGYTGKFELEDKTHRFMPTLLGKAVWEGGRFVALEWVASGARKGGTKYNFRGGDMGEAPMGVSLTLAGGE